MSRRRHEITAAAIADPKMWTMAACATTIHTDKRKQLDGAVGRTEWRVTVGDEVTYQGDSLSDAVAEYNEAG